MISKKGITLTVMAITIVIMLIIAGTITISTYSTISYSRLSSWANEIMYIQDIVNEQLNETSAFLYTLEEASININGLTEEQKESQFVGETIDANGLVKLKVLDLGNLNITDTVYGKMETAADVYAVSETTGRVYYVQGIEIDDSIYYTLTDSLKQRFDLTKNTGTLTSVVFTPSVLGYTNQPIQVTIKVPNTFTNIVISTSNSQVNVGSQTTLEKVYQYNINENNIAGNYTITVSYNDGVKTLTSTYEVNGYDVTKPTIEHISVSNMLYKQTDNQTLEYLINIVANDESGIKHIKYAPAIISEAEAESYFKTSGNYVIDGKINLDRIENKYTVYAEDNAGNFVITTWEKPILVSSEQDILSALASDESNIYLLGDIECTSPITITSGNHSIDLNGHSITYTKNNESLTFITIEQGANVVVKDTSENKDGTISAQVLEETYNGNKEDRVNTLYTIANKGTLTVESGKVESTLKQLPGEVKVNLHSKCLAKTINNTGTLNLNGGTINSYIDSQGVSYTATRNGEATAIGIENTGTVNLNSGTITAEAHANMEKTGAVWGETRAYAYGITNTSPGTVNNSGNVSITVTAEAHSRDTYKTKEDSAEIQQN